MDKEMEKKRSPLRKGKARRQEETRPEPDIVSSSTYTANENGKFETAEFNARVARMAYELFERRGDGSGNDVEDWLTAEQLVKEEIARERS